MTYVCILCEIEGRYCPAIEFEQGDLVDRMADVERMAQHMEHAGPLVSDIRALTAVTRQIQRRLAEWSRLARSTSLRAARVQLMVRAQCQRCAAVAGGVALPNQTFYCQSHFLGQVRAIWEAHCTENAGCLLYTSPSPRDVEESRMPSSA